jgi:hypothetical protein
MRQYSGSGQHNAKSLLVQYANYPTGPWYNASKAGAFTLLCYTPVWQEFGFSSVYSALYWRLSVLESCDDNANSTTPRIRDVQLYSLGTWIAESWWIIGENDETKGLLDGDIDTYWQPSDAPSEWKVDLKAGESIGSLF